jgi:hypothetical protein
MSLIAASLFALNASAAVLPETVGLHLVSVHAEDGKSASGSRGWNNATYGAYAIWSNGFTVGAYRNSLYRQSYYAGWTLSHGPFAITLGAVTGYDRVVTSGGDHTAIRCESVCREVQLKDVILPMVAPSVVLPITNNTNARLILMVAPRSPAALNFSIERTF